MLPLVARLLLAAVFAASGLAKLFSRPTFQQSLLEFGTPASLVAPLSVVLPASEVAIAGLLLPAEGAWYASIGAFLLLMTFSIGIAANLLRGRRPGCGCFGPASTGPIGWRTLARNGILGAVAGLVVLHGPGRVGPSAVAWLGELTLEQRLALGGFGLLLGFVAFEAWVLSQLARETGRLLLRLAMLEERLAALTRASVQSTVDPSPGPPVVSGGPRFDVAAPNGETISLDVLGNWPTPG